MKTLAITSFVSFLMFGCSGADLNTAAPDPGDPQDSQGSQESGDETGGSDTDRNSDTVDAAPEMGADTTSSEDSAVAPDSGSDSALPDTGVVSTDTAIGTDTAPALDTAIADTGCVRRTCASAAVECGSISDGCGGTVDCGGCSGDLCTTGTRKCVANHCVPDVSPPSCDDGESCTIDSCSGSGCAHSNLANGSSCTVSVGGSLGACNGGHCCAGCVSGSTCLAGNTVAFCGLAGAVCKSCDDGNPCTIDSCDGAGACTHAFSPKGTVCGGTGSCDTGTCYPCGVAGGPCCGGTSCGSGLVCDTASNTCGSPPACGGAGQPCCSGSSCFAGGTACIGGTCSACGSLKGQPCCPGTATTAPSCSSGLSCAVTTCQCGGNGQPCCTSSVAPGSPACNTPSLFCMGTRCAPTP